MKTIQYEGWQVCSDGRLRDAHDAENFHDREELAAAFAAEKRERTKRNAGRYLFAAYMVLFAALIARGFGLFQ